MFGLANRWARILGGNSRVGTLAPVPTPPARTPKAVRPPLWKRVLLVALAPVMLPAMLAAFIGIILFSTPLLLAAAVRSRVQGRRVKARMRATSRDTDWRTVERDLQHGSGTFIWESLTLGWNEYRIWWIAEDVRAVATDAGLTQTPEDGSHEIDPEDPDLVAFRAFERWCCDRYIDLDRGCARLVEVIHSSRGGRKARQRIEALRRTTPSVGLIDINIPLLSMAHRCSQCGYDRIGLGGAPCPECGTRVAAGNVTKS